MARHHAGVADALHTRPGVDRDKEIENYRVSGQVRCFLLESGNRLAKYRQIPLLKFGIGGRGDV
jgi:hypothetical protein